MVEQFQSAPQLGLNSASAAEMIEHQAGGKRQAQK
jgi:hypothetical protein